MHRNSIVPLVVACLCVTLGMETDDLDGGPGIDQCHGIGDTYTNCELPGP
jgi:hypothetical protein